MVAIELAASCSPLKKSNASATAIRPARIGRLRMVSIAEYPLHVINNECADLVRHVLQAVDHLLEMIVDLGPDDEAHRIAFFITLPVSKEQRLAALIVKLVGTVFDRNDLPSQS